MENSKQAGNTSAPATQHDLEVWGGNLAEQIDDLRNDHGAQLKEHKQILLDMLEMITAINSKLDPIQRHEDRIANHEERIEKLEVKVRILQK